VVQKQAWLDGPSYKVEHAVALVLNLLGNASRPVRDALHGTWLGHPVHPILTDLPVGAWTATVVLDATGRRRAAGYRDAATTTLAVGIAGAAAAAATGLADWQHTQDNARRVGLAHGTGNAAVLGLQLASWSARRRGAHRRGRLLSIGAYAGLLATAYLGGTLVFRERIGTTHAPDELEPRTFTRAVRFDSLAVGDPREVDVAGIPIVLVRESIDRVVALGGRCAHQGAPLGEGWIRRGALVCPWHGSAYELDTGAVRHGPATAPLPCYEVRRVDGWVEVRRRPFQVAASPGRSIVWQQRRVDGR
jgi:nitrite reductase/ring-hydroxylating ferredoxin subunit/uncharacterized membrane protein